MRYPAFFPQRAIPAWLLGGAVALVAGGASSTLLIPVLEDEKQPPAWMSITTANLAAEAKECYRREAKWHASTYCDSPVADVVEVVWASCFAEEQTLILVAIEDSDSDKAGMEFLADLEGESRDNVVSMIQEGQLISPHCSNSN